MSADIIPFRGDYGWSAIPPGDPTLLPFVPAERWRWPISATGECPDFGQLRPGACTRFEADAERIIHQILPFFSLKFGMIFLTAREYPNNAKRSTPATAFWVWRLDTAIIKWRTRHDKRFKLIKRIERGVTRKIEAVKEPSL
jgi:hypothetical protein